MHPAHYLMFFLLRFWWLGPWGHYQALKTLTTLSCNLFPTKPIQGPGALFKLSLGILLLLSKMLWGATLHFSYSSELAISPADLHVQTDKAKTVLVLALRHHCEVV